MKILISQEDNTVEGSESVPMNEITHSQSVLSEVPAPLPSIQEARKPITERLNELVERDQQYRSKVDPERIKKAQEDPLKREKFLQEMRLADRVNRKAVLQMMKDGELQTGGDFAKAALIFQHGELPEDFMTAFQLSQNAIHMGLMPSQTVLFQAFDRYMIETQLRQGLPIEMTHQRFGTQTYPDNEGRMISPELDGLATEEEISLRDMKIQLSEDQLKNVCRTIGEKFGELTGK